MTLNGPVTEITKLMADAVESAQNGVDSLLTAGQKLSSIPGLLRGYETIGIQKFDFSEFADDDSVLSDFVTKLSNLNQAQRESTLSLSSMTDAQNNSVSSMLKAIDSGEALNSSLYRQTLAAQGFDSQTQQSILSMSGLIDSTGKYNIVATEQAKAAIQNTTASLGLSKSQQAAAAQAVTSTIALQAQTVATNGLTTAQIALNAVIGIGKQLLIGFAVGAVIYGIQAIIDKIGDLIVTYDELVESAEQAKQDYESQTDKIEELNNKIDENTKKKQESANSEYNLKIDEENELLETQVRLYESLAKAKAKEANENVSNAFNTTQNREVPTTGINTTTFTARGNLTDDEYMRSLYTGRMRIEMRRKELSDSYAAIENPTDQQSEAFKSQMDALDKAAQESEEAVDSLAQSVNELFQNAVDDGSSTYDEIESFFNGIMDMWNAYHDNFMDDSEEEEGAVEKTYDVTAVQKYLNAMKNLMKLQASGSTNTERSEAVVRQYWDDLSSLAKDAGMSVQDYIAAALNLETATGVIDGNAEAWEALNEKVDKVQEAYEVGMTAVSEYQSYGSVSIDTLQDMINLGDQYIAYLVDENGQIQFNEQGLINLANARLDEMKAQALEQAIDTISSFADEAEAVKYLKGDIEDLTQSRLNDADAAMSQAAASTIASLGPDATEDQISTVQAAIDKVMSVYNAIDAQIENTRNNLGNYHTWNYSPSTNKDNQKKEKEEKKEITDAIGAWQNLYDAMDEYNKYGQISYNTLKSLTDMEEDLTKCLVKENGQLTINVDSYKKLIEKQLQETASTEDSSTSTEELTRMMQWLDENAQSGTITLEQLRDAIEGVGTSLDNTQDEMSSFADAIDPLFNLSFDKFGGKFFDRETIDEVIDAEQALSTFKTTLADGSVGNVYTQNDKVQDFFGLDYAMIEAKGLEMINEEIEKNSSAGNETAVRMLEQTKEALLAGEQSWADYLLGVSTTIDLVNDKLDGSQEAYTTMIDAVEEYNTHGQLTQDTIQSLLSLDPKYTACLTVEGDLLKFNADKFKELYKAELLSYAASVEAAGGNEELVAMLMELANNLDNVDYHMRGASDSVDDFKSALSDLENVLDYVLGLWQDGLDDQSNNLQIWGDAIQDELDDRIDALEDQKDALKDSNDEEERAIELAKLQAQLEEARTNKTVRKYVEGQGYIWTVDENAVREAENALNEKQREWQKEDELEAAEKAIDDQIDKLNDLKDKYSEVTGLIGKDWDDYQAQLEAEAAAQGMTLDEMESNLDGYKDSVVQNMKDINKATDLSEGISKLQEFAGVLENVWSIIQFLKPFITNDGTTGGFFQTLGNVVKNFFGGGEGDGTGTSIFGESNNESSSGGGLLSNLWNGVKNFFGGGSSTTATGSTSSGGGILSNLFNGAKTFIGNVGGTFKDGFVKITDIAKNLFTGGGGVVETLGNGFTGIASSVGNFFSNIGTTLGGGASSIASTAGSLISSIGGTFTTGMSGVVSTVGSAFSSISAAGTSFLGGLGSMLGSLASALPGIGIAAGAVGVGLAANAGLGWVSDTANEKSEQAAEEGKTLQSFGWKLLSAAANGIRNPISAIGNGIKTIGKFLGFASGTTNVPNDNLYNVDELGQEIIVRKPQSGRYTYLETGDGVVPADITKRLFEMGGDPNKWIRKQLQENGILNAQISSGGNNTTISIGDIVIEQPVGDANSLAKQIKRDLPNMLIQELSKR